MTQKQERNHFIGGCIAMAVFMCGMLYLVSTNKPPVIDTPTRDTQTYQKPNYELGSAYKKYMQGCYDGSHEKN